MNTTAIYKRKWLLLSQGWIEKSGTLVKKSSTTVAPYNQVVSVNRDRRILFSVKWRGKYV